ncbi:proline iminopeptidase [Actinoplanes philippinensis]|uniref:Proline iminopeptidase n=1 Tax=Actinoplanes philippinensis TaxID=35752 RepID=A0A1I2HKY3_9ACTN|nr:proline iminopeptidase [Actinoplanes philippinensis]
MIDGVTRTESRHVVRVGDLSLVCHVRGRGPRCVAHPAGPGMHWEYLRMPLAERDHTMIYVEPAGTGASGSLPDGAAYDLDTYVSHLDAVVRAFADEPVFVLGHGHGGFITQSYVAGLPDGVAGLILYATGPVADAQMLAQARWNLHRDADEDVHDEESATRRLRGVLPSHFAHYREREAEFAPVVAAVRCWPRPASDFAAVDLRGRLASITVPTLILAGARDVVFGPEAAAALRAGVPGARVAIFEDSGRFAHLEEPQRFAHLLREFTG